MEYVFLKVLAGVIVVGISYWLKTRDEDSPTDDHVVKKNGIPQNQYELVDFDDSKFVLGGTTEERFQAHIRPYIQNGYRIHTMDVVNRKAWYAYGNEKRTYRVLFEKTALFMMVMAAVA